MGIDNRRPPLPAPTESMYESTGNETEVATNVTNRTDKSSYEIPEDGSPITISTHKLAASKEAGRPAHHRQKSQTSLLIEYFEASKTGDKSRSRPSVRVKVTPSSNKKSRNGGHDAVQVTSIGKDRKSSYTRRISLGSSKNVENGLAPTEGTELSHSSESNVSGRPPVEIEVLHHNGSDMSAARSSRGLFYAPNESNVSSMPPDSMLEGSNLNESELSQSVDESTVTDANHLKAPVRSRSRSTSQDRITQKVMEKLGQTGGKSRKSSRSSRERSISKEYDEEGRSKERRRRSSKSHQYDDETVSGAESSLLSSNLAPSTRSYRSGTSQGSRMTNNPKLLEMVEDTIKRMILPEINAIKQDQKTDRNTRSSEGRRSSLPRDGYESSGLERRVSKSSSTPNITGRPKVVLNRDGDDPGTVLSRGDSERKRTRRSSRGSATEERPSSRRSSGRHSSHGTRDAAAAGMAGGILTAAALKHHDSQDNVHERRKKSSKSRSSRSRSASIAETNEEAYTKKEDIPPLPMASNINDSDVTRDSIVSAATERPGSRHSEEVRTPIREVSRGSLQEQLSPASSRTPTGMSPRSGSRGLGMSHNNQSISSSHSGISTKARMAALTAAGLGGLGAAKSFESQADRHVDADGYGESNTRRKMASPVHSVSSLKKQFEDEDALVPQGLRPKSAASRSSAGQLREEKTSHSSLRSPQSSPTTQKLASSRKQSQSYSGDDFVTPLERPSSGFMRGSTPGTPNGESVDDWYERQHQLNDRYRDSYGETTNRDSYQTNPYPEDDKRFTQYTDDSYGSAGMDGEQNVNRLGANPIFGTPAGVESNVASLVEPSTMSSNMMSSQGGSAKTNGSFSDRLRDLGKDGPPIYEGSTLSDTMPSQDRWAAIKGHARNLSANTSNDNVNSPRQSPAKSLQQEGSFDSQPVMGASGLPVANDPLPEIGHFDDTRSEISTNPSIIKGPLGGDASGKSTWPYTPEPHEKEVSARDSRSLRSGNSKHDGLLAAAAGGAAALAAAHAAKQPSVHDEEDEQARGFAPDSSQRGGEIDREATPTSPAMSRDEGYVTDAHARSTGTRTPRAGQERYSKEDLDEYHRAMDAQSLGGEDPFTGAPKHTRNVSGNSHGMASPLYDSSTGKGLDRIESKDIVALMDHLTVRDAQRNARDTEILVTLVRSATEMRQSFDEIKKFIVEQDRMIMQNTDRDAEQTVQKVLGGPRPQPASSPRTPRRESQEDVQAKRKGVLRRALKGLTGSKKADDLARVEDMLMQILDNVEDLKQGGGVTSRAPMSSYTTDTLDSYEKLRTVQDSGYEPEGQAGTSSTPSHSGHLSMPGRPEARQFHSGYDGRRDSYNRVSTVHEGDEEELTPDEDHLLKHQFENNERMLTPTQEHPRRYAATYSGGPFEEFAPKSAEKQRKHKSNSSSLFGVPKVSRWSKTTASSGAPDPATLDSPNISRGVRPISGESRPKSELDDYNSDDDGYSLQENDPLRSNPSLARNGQENRPTSQADSRSLRSSSHLTRTPSPLIPSEAPSASPRHSNDEEDEDFDDPKYQAVRNSLLLQHPQPRQGTTGRHQNTLETRAAQDYYGAGPASNVSAEGASSVSASASAPTGSDLSQRSSNAGSDFDPAMWGSSGTAALARRPVARKDDGPLIPVKQEEEEEEEEWDEPEFSNSGFSRGGGGGGANNNYYSSPFGSGHLLEPIEEVRYSLETDSGRSPEPQIAMTARKITGPRPMMGRWKGSAGGKEEAVRRKPVGGGGSYASPPPTSSP